MSNNNLSSGSQIVLRTAIWLNRWSTARDIAPYTAFDTKEIRAFLSELHARRELSRYRDYFGALRYARLSELVGVPFRSRGA